MNSDGVDSSRRRFLTASTVAVGAVGGIFTAVPFLSSFNPSAKARSAGAPVSVNVSKMEEGEQLRVEWQGKPVFIVKRSQAVLKDIEASIPIVADPESNESLQPEYAKNQYRSIKPEYLVLTGLCTHLGCSPSYSKELDSISTGRLGGFFCPCHGSKFDMAGRVYKSVPAPLNLEIPKHAYIDDQTIIIGADATTGGIG